MRICGVELTGNDAVVCLLELIAGQFTLPECRVRKISLPKEHSREDLQKFQAAFTKLMQDYKVTNVVIRERMTKGKFAGGAVSFKMEAAIQLIDEIGVDVMSPAAIKQSLAENPLPIPFADTGLKVFQEQAFTVAYAAHMSPQ
ncbi:DUF3010 family protein [Gilvimarinus sp. SDUM040013]|uniref:DUF3010 family protein n=1 Tax=Gilvimarinus gilvus TaxID=3058038 RepID=A0ABU4S0W6_9GAMM|nr:DUF3010 family protein [Gilvimarinus sp. SDUM040013]MDO3384491.1 DUF3010 family protein [Gilvimarinus sp. SDUM040013]MDX6850732.1 DUF3010 family protein [Gilvimarinus sp. SDUM040013]